MLWLQMMLTLDELDLTLTMKTNVNTTVGVKIYGLLIQYSIVLIGERTGDTLLFGVISGIKMLK